MPPSVPIHRLRPDAKETIGGGYSVEWEEIASRKHGRNFFPRRIVFQTADDFLLCIGKQGELARFASAVEQVRYQYPDLEPWIRSHRQLLIDSVSELEGLLQVVDYLHLHPRPGLFARELPLEVDTKFIERNRRILRDWLDLVLPPHTIRADEDHFERRYGLRYAEPHVLVRFLDEEMQRTIGVPWSECSVPLQALAATSISAERVLIIENKVNLLTLPRMRRTLALGGLGNSVIDLRYVDWLAHRNIWYWGDIDVEGFAILSRLRAMFPHIRSLLMDIETVHRWREHIACAGTGHATDPPPNLSPLERSAYLVCAAENLRIEQERFPQPFVPECLQASFAGPTRSEPTS